MTNDLIQKVRKYVRKLIHHERRFEVTARYDTSDIAQDVTLQTSRSFPSVDSMSDIPRAWLAKIVKGHLSNARRRHNTQKRSVSREVTVESTQPVSDITDPQIRVQKFEFVKRLWEVLSELDPIEQKIFKMRTFENATYDSIAEATGIPLHTARNIYLRTRKKIQTKMAEY